VDDNVEDEPKEEEIDLMDMMIEAGIRIVFVLFLFQLLPETPCTRFLWRMFQEVFAST
jgi:hypothetical protein